MYLLLAGRPGSLDVKILQNSTNGLLLFFVGLIPALTYLVGTGADRTVVISTHEAGHEYSVEVRAPGAIFRRFKLGPNAELKS